MGSVCTSCNHSNEVTASTNTQNPGIMVGNPTRDRNIFAINQQKQQKDVEDDLTQTTNTKTQELCRARNQKAGIISLFNFRKQPVQNEQEVFNKWNMFEEEVEQKFKDEEYASSGESTSSNKRRSKSAESKMANQIEKLPEDGAALFECNSDISPVVEDQLEQPAQEWLEMKIVRGAQDHKQKKLELKQQILEQMLMDMMGESFHQSNEGVSDDDEAPLKNRKERNITEQRFLERRQRMQAFKNKYQTQQAYYKHFKEEVEQNILTDLKAELDMQSLARSSVNNDGEKTDENSQNSVRLRTHFFGHLQGGKNKLRSRDRNFSNGESDLDSLYFSNNDLIRSFARNFDKFKTSDDGGITNQEESATDNDSDIRSFLAGIGSSQKGQHILLSKMKSMAQQIRPQAQVVDDFEKTEVVQDSLFVDGFEEPKNEKFGQQITKSVVIQRQVTFTEEIYNPEKISETAAPEVAEQIETAESGVENVKNSKGPEGKKKWSITTVETKIKEDRNVQRKPFENDVAGEEFDHPLSNTLEDCVQKKVRRNFQNLKSKREKRARTANKQDRSQQLDITTHERKEDKCKIVNPILSSY